MKTLSAFVLATGLLSLIGLSTIVVTPDRANAEAVLELLWEDLIPQKGKGIKIVIDPKDETIGLPKRENFDGSDDDFAYLLDSLESLKYTQPLGGRLKKSLDGKLVRIPGYVTPLSFIGEELAEFLLVPYHGACIHVPPPPANQLVLVNNATGVDEERLYEPIWITGVLRVQAKGTAVADVGYVIENAKAEPYSLVE